MDSLMDLKETDILGADIADHWYYKSKVKAMMRVIGEAGPSKILDVGAGSGFFSRYLLSHSSAQEAWCVDVSYESDADSCEAGKDLYFRRSIESVDADLVLLMDVLEHVDDDVQLLKEYADKVPRGSRFLISVPAFQFLWSGHDDFLDHKRRYTFSELKDVVSTEGLRIESGSYYFGMVFSIATTLRLASRLRRNQGGVTKSQLVRHHPLVNIALATLCQAELPFMRLNRFAGLTVFCLAESL
jgi:SAM-dependent methyltransferase